MTSFHATPAAIKSLSLFKPRNTNQQQKSDNYQNSLQNNRKSPLPLKAYNARHAQESVKLALPMRNISVPLIFISYKSEIFTELS